MSEKPKNGLIQKVDCIRIPVPDLEEGLKFYRDNLGHEIIWRNKTAIGLRIPKSEAELVIHTEADEFEVDLQVESVEIAVQRIVDAGGSVFLNPFDIKIGKCVIVKDPWGNKLVLLDATKGIFITNEKGNIIGQNKSNSA